MEEVRISILSRRAAALPPNSGARIAAERKLADTIQVSDNIQINSEKVLKFY